MKVMGYELYCIAYIFNVDVDKFWIILETIQCLI